MITDLMTCPGHFFFRFKILNISLFISHLSLVKDAFKKIKTKFF